MYVSVYISIAQNTMKTENQCCLKLQLYMVCSNFRNLKSKQTDWLFNSENIELLKTLCKFILKHDLP